MVAVRRAPTLRGPVALTLRSRRGGATLSWDARVAAGTRLEWLLPAGVTGVSAPGLDRGRGIILLGRPRGTLRVTWTLRR